MKSPRSAVLALALLTLPLAVFAAQEDAKVTSDNGGARADTSPLTLGKTVTAGSVIETDAASTLYIELPNGGTLVIGPSTRARVISFSKGGNSGTYSLELILTRGTITGDTTNAGSASSVKIRTTSGVARVTGTSFQVSFAPARPTGGTLTVTALNGIASISPAAALTVVPVQPGSTMTLTTDGNKAGTPQVTSTSALTLARIESTLSGKPASGESGQVLTKVMSLPRTGGVPNFDATTITTGNGSNPPISPNGEGSIIP